MTRPEIGSCWRHTKTGMLYEVGGFLTLCSSSPLDGQTLVLYAPWRRFVSASTFMLGWPLFGRPLDEFMDGRFVEQYPPAQESV